MISNIYDNLIVEHICGYLWFGIWWLYFGLGLIDLFSGSKCLIYLVEINGCDFVLREKLGNYDLGDDEWHIGWEKKLWSKGSNYLKHLCMSMEMMLVSLLRLKEYFYSYYLMFLRF